MERQQHQQCVLNLQDFIPYPVQILPLKDFLGDTSHQKTSGISSLSDSVISNGKVQNGQSPCPFDCCQKGLKSTYFKNCELTNATLKMRISSERFGQRCSGGVPCLEGRTIYEGKVTEMPMRYEDLIRESGYEVTGVYPGRGSAPTNTQEILRRQTAQHPPARTNYAQSLITTNEGQYYSAASHRQFTAALALAQNSKHVQSNIYNNRILAQSVQLYGHFGTSKHSPSGTPGHNQNVSVITRTPNDSNNHFQAQYNHSQAQYNHSHFQQNNSRQMNAGVTYASGQEGSTEPLKLTFHQNSQEDLKVNMGESIPPNSAYKGDPDRKSWSSSIEVIPWATNIEGAIGSGQPRRSITPAAALRGLKRPYNKIRSIFQAQEDSSNKKPTAGTPEEVSQPLRDYCSSGDPTAAEEGQGAKVSSDVDAKAEMGVKNLQQDSQDFMQKQLSSHIKSFKYVKQGMATTTATATTTAGSENTTNASIGQEDGVRNPLYQDNPQDKSQDAGETVETNPTQGDSNTDKPQQPPQQAEHHPPVYERQRSPATGLPLLNRNNIKNVKKTVADYGILELFEAQQLQQQQRTCLAQSQSQTPTYLATPQKPVEYEIKPKLNPAYQDGSPAYNADAWRHYERLRKYWDYQRQLQVAGVNKTASGTIETPREDNNSAYQTHQQPGYTHQQPYYQQNQSGEKDLRQQQQQQWDYQQGSLSRAGSTTNPATDGYPDAVVRQHYQQQNQKAFTQLNQQRQAEQYYYNHRQRQQDSQLWLASRQNPQQQCCADSEPEQRPYNAASVQRIGNDNALLRVSTNLLHQSELYTRSLSETPKPSSNRIDPKKRALDIAKAYNESNSGLIISLIDGGNGGRGSGSGSGERGTLQMTSRVVVGDLKNRRTVRTPTKFVEGGQNTQDDGDGVLMNLSMREVDRGHFSNADAHTSNLSGDEDKSDVPRDLSLKNTRSVEDYPTDSKLLSSYVPERLCRSAGAADRYDHIVLIDQRLKTYMCKRCFNPLKTDTEIRNHLFCKRIAAGGSGEETSGSVECHICHCSISQQGFADHLRIHDDKTPTLGY